MDNIRSHLSQLQLPFTERSAELAASAIMTTDTHPKFAAATAESAMVVGIAKGVGMIEPDMATMIAVIATDAEISHKNLNEIFRRASTTHSTPSVSTPTLLLATWQSYLLQDKPDLSTKLN